MAVKKADKEDIIICASRLFQTKGYYGTTMASIGKAVGLLKGSLYHYFPSKEDLFLAVLEQATQEWEKGAFALAYEDQVPAKARLSAMMGWIEERFRNEPINLMLRARLDDPGDVPGMTLKVEAFYQRWRDALAYVLMAGHPEQQAQRLAEEAIARIEGVTLLGYPWGKRDLLKRVCDDTRALVPL